MKQFSGFVITGIITLLLQTTALQGFAQMGNLKIKKAGIAVQPKAASLTDQKALNENFKMNSPAENQDLTKPFHIAGYGVPGAKIEIRVMPVSKPGNTGQMAVISVPRGQQNPYNIQNYTTTVRDNGSWSLSTAVTVKFYNNATQKRVQIFAGQSKDGMISKNPVTREIKLTDPIKVISVPIGLLTDDKVQAAFEAYTKNGNNISASSASTQTIPVGASSFNIQGTAAPKSKTTVEVYYSGTKEVYKKSGSVAGIKVYTEKEVTNIKNKKLAAWEYHIGEDGKWSTPAIDPYQPKSGDIGTTLIMSQIVIYFKAYNGNKEVLNKSVTLMVMPGLNMSFF